VPQLPPLQQAGAYSVIGRALDHQQRLQEASLAWLRIPILYPQQDALAADALSEAARLLDKLGQNAEAYRLREELVRRYPDTPAGAHARQQSSPN
jgi:TolA-binding protein